MPRYKNPFFFLKQKSIPAVLVIVAVLTGGCGQPNAEVKTKPKEGIHVRTAKVQHIRLAEAIRVTGLLTGKEESRLSFKIGGIIDKILVREGQVVKKGQLLATLKLSEINAQVNQAKNARDKAERDLNRTRNLYDDKVATLEQLQDATTGFEVAKSNYDIARFNQEFASIYAPSNGIVQKKFAEENELVGPGTPIFQLNNASKGWVVKVGLSDRDVVRVATGDSCTVHLDAYPNTTFAAVVSQIAGTASPMTGTFDAELTVLPGSTKLISGLVAKATVQPSAGEQVSLIPIEAFVEGDKDDGFVYAAAADNRSVKKVSVKKVSLYQSSVVIGHGLDNVNAVVTDGAAYLTDGAAVQVVK